MFKDYKTICIAIICFVMLGTVITGCHHTANTDTISNDEQKQEPSEVQFTFYPSGADFIESIIDKRGNVEITDDMRKKFNLFARDYRWCYMPDMDGYESFFEANEYAKSFGYNNFGFAVFYVLHYMKCPEKMSDDAMQSAIQSLFVAKDSYQDMPHQVYPRLANYEDGHYSLWPEGMPDHNRKFYLLTKLDIVPHETDGVYITVHTKEYYFHDSLYEPGENEKWLAEKSQELGIPEMQAAAKLLANGEMEEIEGRYEFETIIYINNSGENPHGMNPRFVSIRSRDIEYQ